MNNIVLAIVLVLVALAWFGPVIAAVYIEEQDRKKRGELPQEKNLYDERQRTLRCRAALHALICVLVYLVVWAGLDLCEIFAWTKESFVFAMLAVILAYGVWMGECILRDVAVGWNIKVKNKKSLYHYIVLCNLGVFFYNFEHTEIKIVSAAICITGFAMIILHLYANYRKKKSERLAKDFQEEVEEL